MKDRRICDSGFYLDDGLCKVYITFCGNGNNNIKNNDNNYSCLLLSTSYIIGTESAFYIILPNLPNLIFT